MIILQETSEEQELNIIARDSRINLLTFTDEQTNKVVTVTSVDFIDAGYYLTADVILDFLKEDHTYRMRAYNTAKDSFFERVEKDGGSFDLSTNDCLNYLNEIDAKISFNSLVFVTNENLDLRMVESLDELYVQNNTDSEYITYED